jgi:Glycosyltransferase like family 2
MTGRVGALGIVVPSRQDGPYAAATVRALLASADRATVPVSVVLVDDGDNGGLAGEIPADARLRIVETVEHGPGRARTAGAQVFTDLAKATGTGTGGAWLVSLDADVSFDADFVTGWIDTIESTVDDVLAAPAFFGAVGAETELAADVEAASSWMWGDTALYERFVGLVNVGGCNHAVSLAVGQEAGWYLQPTQVIGGVRTIVAGDDWDFGLRARMSGATTARVPGPAVTTSSRRIAADPVGFLAGRSYERPFEPIRGVAAATSWPPGEPWSAVARHGRARLVAHFLAKPLLAGIPPTGALEWFLGPPLSVELEKLAAGAPTWQPGQDWNEYRTTLVELCFSDEVFGWCERVARQIAGGN